MLRYFQKSRKKENSQLNQSLSFLLHVMLKDFVQKKNENHTKQKVRRLKFSITEIKTLAHFGTQWVRPFPFKDARQAMTKNRRVTASSWGWDKLWDADEPFTRWAAEPTVIKWELFSPYK